LRAALDRRGVRHGLVLLAVLLVPVVWEDMPSLARCGLPGSTDTRKFLPGEALGARGHRRYRRGKLTRFGQWPWPRTLVARLFDRIAASRPPRSALTSFFLSPDRLSPEWLAPTVADADPRLASACPGFRITTRCSRRRSARRRWCWA